jgi:hypothetical protein
MFKIKGKKHFQLLKKYYLMLRAGRTDARICCDMGIITTIAQPHREGE